MKWVVADGGDADRASSSESDEDEELAGLEADYQALGDGDQGAQEAAGPPAAQPKAPKERISIKLGAAGADACHVRKAASLGCWHHLPWLRCKPCVGRRRRHLRGVTCATCAGPRMSVCRCAGSVGTQRGL